jgi:hypothetical protein
MRRVAEGWPVVEPVPVKDIFATEIADIEIVGDMVRFVLCTQQHVPGTALYEKVIVAKIVAPYHCAVDMTEQSRDALATTCEVLPFKPRP